MAFHTQTESQLREMQASLMEHLNTVARDEAIHTTRKNGNPKIWGPSGWKFLDKVVEGYPKRASHSDQVQMLDFLTSLGHALPCSKCRENYVDFTLKYPPIEYVGSKCGVKRWLKAHKRKLNRVKR